MSSLLATCVSKTAAPLRGEYEARSASSVQTNDAASQAIDTNLLRVLPDDVIRKILGTLPSKDIVTASGTATHMRRFCRESSLWTLDRVRDIGREVLLTIDESWAEVPNLRALRFIRAVDAAADLVTQTEATLPFFAKHLKLSVGDTRDLPQPVGALVQDAHKRLTRLFGDQVLQSASSCQTHWLRPAMVAPETVGAAIEQISALGPDPVRAQAMYALSFVARETEGVDVPMMATQAASKLDSTNAAYHYASGLLHKDRGALELSLAAFAQAVQLDPGNGWYIYAQGGAHDAVDDRATARALYRLARQVEPGNRNLQRAARYAERL